MQAVGRQGGRPNISRISVATGMTRKEVSALLSDSPKERSAAAKRSGQQRAMRVLRGWMTDARFQNRKGLPDELRYRGHQKSFAMLVRLYGGDVTPNAVLRELERMDAVDTNKSGAVRLRVRRTRSNTEIHYRVSDLARLFEGFAYAITRSGLKSEAPSFFAFKDFTVPSEGDAAYFMRRFSKRAAALVEDFEQWSAGRESSTEGLSRQRVALGVYLLRSCGPSTNSASSESAVPVRLRRRERRLT